VHNAVRVKIDQSAEDAAEQLPDGPLSQGLTRALGEHRAKIPAWCVRADHN
jgi:hypothetical protein